MKLTCIYLLAFSMSVSLFSCNEKESSKPVDEQEEGIEEQDEVVGDFELNELTGDKFIADYLVAKEEVLRSIPQKYIDIARNNLHIAYQHTSHGTHVTYGLFGLQDYKTGDDALFAVTKSYVDKDGKFNDNSEQGKLDLQDYVIEYYAEDGVDASDLSRDETAFIQTTRNYLDDPDNAEINVVMWAWCSIRNHDLQGVYLPGMKTLIDEYGVGGTKIGNGDGQRQNPVYFVFMTGHASDSGNLDEGDPAPQAAIVNEYCQQNQFLCLDYFSIDSHCMNDNYWDDAGDDGNSYKYNNSTAEEGYFYHDWQDSHQLGIDYFENKVYPNNKVAFGQHTTQHITANRKAYAMWWILARISGWDGISED
ncbi:hypothetical protein KEM09_17230 [Carboxylicivirga mesophila]|uniref:Uncharacterized protein n=1 Tax=Carboxylicivirga mesophila TaxID=1166478 RepID=A0ABS5KDQ4_9BACT|nr:hypothetical protein [Carboxylicivirga mesophila]MBS2213163.1 hypothetical protein [Carboxylicivirga mesophila]